MSPYGRIFLGLLIALILLASKTGRYDLRLSSTRGHQAWSSQQPGGGAADKNGDNSENTTAPQAALLPRPLQLMRRNVPLRTTAEYGGVTIPEPNSTECSCSNPGAGPDCCSRNARTEHKFGVILTRKVFRRPTYEGEVAILSHSFRALNVHTADLLRDSPSGIGGTASAEDAPANKDFRDVMVFRNVYSALVSGYQVRAEN